MHEKDIVETIKRLGLTEYEAKVYLALIKNGLSTAGELTLLSGVPHSRIYGVLQTLEAKNWVIREGVSSRGGIIPQLLHYIIQTKGDKMPKDL